MNKDIIKKEREKIINEQLIDLGKKFIRIYTNETSRYAEWHGTLTEGFKRWVHQKFEGVPFQQLILELKQLINDNKLIIYVVMKGKDGTIKDHSEDTRLSFLTVDEKDMRIELSVLCQEKAFQTRNE